MFRDITVMWKLVASKDILKLLDGFINTDNLVDLCFIFNNAYNCMNGNEISQWFQLQPPSFAIYTSQGKNKEN